MTGVNREVVNDRARLIMHRLIARWLVSNPELITKALRRLEDLFDDGRHLHCYYEWKDILTSQPIESVRRLIVQRDEKMYRLRISSPLPVVAPLKDEQLRRRIWRKAKLGLEKNVA